MNRQEWETPPAFIEWVERVVLPRYGYDKFDLDVCAYESNKKALYYIGPPGVPGGEGWIGENAFETLWPGNARWCNPGFTDIEPWFLEARKNVDIFGGIVVIVSHAQHSTKWHRTAFNIATERIDVNPRVNYLPPPGVTPSSNTKDTHLWVITEQPGPATVWYPEPWRTYGK